MPSVAHAIGLVALSERFRESGEYSEAAARLRLAADELDALAAMRPSRIAMEDDHARAAFERAVKGEGK